MGHRDDASVAGGVKGGGERDVADGATGQLDPGQPLVVQGRRRRGDGEDAAPDGRALRCAGERKLDDEPQSADERVVHGALEIGREDGEARVRFHALEEIGNLQVGVAIAAVVDLAAFPEQRVGFVEQQDRAAALGQLKDLLEVLFRLAGCIC